MKPRLLDLFCGAGGATRGYQLAGFHVTGVDVGRQPSYVGDSFYQTDALQVCPRFLQSFDLIHASPPCQAYTSMSNRHRGQGGAADTHDELISDVREVLAEAGVPWVIENVVGAARALHSPMLLHGGMFGLRVYRPRLFECSELLWSHPHAPAPVNPTGVYGKLDGRRVWTRADGSEQRCASTVEEARSAMGIDWMDWRELCEAIPPAYTRFIGEQLLSSLERVA